MAFQVKPSLRGASQVSESYSLNIPPINGIYPCMGCPKRHREFMTHKFYLRSHHNSIPILVSGRPHRSCQLYPMMNIVTGLDVEIAFKSHLRHSTGNIVGTNNHHLSLSYPDKHYVGMIPVISGETTLRWPEQPSTARSNWVARTYAKILGIKTACGVYHPSFYRVYRYNRRV